MKRSYLSLLLVLLFASCASTQKEQKVTQEDLTPISAPEKIYPFDDWQHMGFGQEVPEWVEVLLSNEIPEIKTTRYYMLFPDITLKDIMTLDVWEDTLDQSESKLKLKIQENSEYIVLQTFWVRTKADQQYHSVALLYK